jgi:4'-phosphopantetheinyl transferase
MPAEATPRIWLLDTEDAATRELIQDWWALLDEGERARAARLLDAEARARFVLSHGLLRQALSRCAPVAPAAWRLRYDTRGRPWIHHPPDTGLFFSLSRCPGQAAVLVGSEPRCGVDVERLGRVREPLAVARTWFHPEECAALAAVEGPALDSLFTRQWAAREACAKALGGGIDVLPRDLWVEQIEDGGALVHAHGEAAGWRIALRRPTAEHVLAVVSERLG